MSFFKAAILGMVQGLTEFLPISSSGHLAIIQNLFGADGEADVFFTSLLHLGTLFAVCFVYGKTLSALIKTLFSSVPLLLKGKISWKNGLPSGGDSVRRKGMLIIYSLLPMFLVLPIKDIAERFYSSTFAVGAFLVLTAVALFLCDKLVVGKKNENDMTVRDAFVVGFAQFFAVLPGLSRSGSTITAGLVCGLDRAFAAEFSFIMSVPTIIASAALQAVEIIIDGARFNADMIPVYAVGVVFSAVSGFAAIKLFEKLLKSKKFFVFSVYCFTVGIVAMISDLLK